MTDLPDAIGNLDDTAAERIRSLVGKHRLKQGEGSVTSLDADLAAALVEAGGQTPPSSGSRGDLARATLLLLADDPARRPELEAIVAHPPAESFALEPLSYVALSSIVLLALQTHVKIEYDKTRGWRIKIEKQPLDKTLFGKVISYLSTLFTQSGK